MAQSAKTRVDDSAEGEDDKTNPNPREDDEAIPNFVNDQSEMTAHLPDEASWHFDFKWDLDEAPGGVLTDDEDTLNSAASEDTWRMDAT